MPSKPTKSSTSIKSTKSITGKTARGTSATRGTVSTSKLSAPVYDAKGAKHGSISLPREIFGTKINNPLMAQAVRVYLANQRTGGASTKGRSDIDLTKAKWYRQKGTGRARHGAKSAPIFVGGGVAHGPKPRDFSLKLPKKMKKASLYSALSQKASAGEIIILQGFSKTPPKTKNMDALIKKITGDSSKGRSASGRKKETRTLLVTSAKPSELENVYRAGRNIKNLEILTANLINTYEILRNKNIFLMKESLEVLENLKGK